MFNFDPEYLKIQLMFLVMRLPIALLAIAIHESAHGFIAHKCGDDTAYNFGRITLNPLKHFDLVGFLCMILVGFGWAKPVPVNSRKFRKYKSGMILTSLAGPASNLILGFIFAVIARLTYGPISKQMLTAATSQQATLWWCLYFMLYVGIQLNIALAVFNLLPIPPLDGSKILFSLLPYKVYYKIMPYEKYISIAFIVLLIVGPMDTVISVGTEFVTNLFFTVLGFNGSILNNMLLYFPFI